MLSDDGLKIEAEVCLQEALRLHRAANPDDERPLELLTRKDMDRGIHFWSL